MSVVTCTEIIHQSCLRIAAVFRLRLIPESRASGSTPVGAKSLPQDYWNIRSLRFNTVITVPAAYWNSFIIALSTSWVATWFPNKVEASENPDVNEPSDEKYEAPKTNPDEGPPSYIRQLMQNPLIYQPIRAPRNPIVLCHGLYGFDVWGPSQFQRHYWSEILEILRKKIQADVIVTSVPPTGSIQDRAKMLDRALKDKASGKEVNFMAHSMGGLDCRHLITHLRPTEYTPLSLTTVATPHRGSPFMDWCNINIGIGAMREAVDSQRKVNVPYSLKSPLLAARTVSTAAATASAAAVEAASDARKHSDSSTFTPMVRYLSSLPQSITSMILSLVDSPAYSNLTTSYLNDYFNPATPNVPGVKYFSIAGRVKEMSVFHPLWLPKLIIDKAEEVEGQAARSSQSTGKHDEWPNSLVGRLPPRHEVGNDGLVTVQSAQWGEFLGVVDGADHWDIRGAGGFSAAWETAGEAGRLGWVKGMDWSKWGMGWLGSSLSDPDPTPRGRKTAQEEESDEMMAWIADHMSRASNQKEAEAELLKIQAPQSNVGLIAPPANHHTKAILEDWDSKKFNLERLYIALTRKLYDEGL